MESLRNLMKLMVIVPALPPKACGLGAYTVQLWRSIFQSNNGESASLSSASQWQFMVASNHDESQKNFPEASVTPLCKDRLASQLEESGSEAVLLQFVGYAYDQHGVPEYLSAELQKWRSRNATRRLIVMFHETWYKDFTPWRRAYWYSSGQRRVVSEILKLSDVAVTTNGYYKSMLDSLHTEKEVKVIPIGSNFVVEPVERDWRKLLIFGLDRVHAIESHEKLLRLLSKEKLIDTITLAGASNGDQGKNDVAKIEKMCPEVQVTTSFNFPLDQVPLAVKQPGLSLVDIHSALLAKSGRFHLSCCLKQVAICQWSTEPGKPFEDRKNYLSYSTHAINQLIPHIRDHQQLQAIGDNAYVLAQTEFDWHHIASQWTSLINNRHKE